MECTEKQWVCCLKLESIEWLKYLDLKNVYLSQLEDSMLYIPPLLIRIFERLCPNSAVLFSYFEERQFQGDLYFTEAAHHPGANVEPRCFPLCFVLNRGVIAWTPKHRLWRIEFSIHLVDQYGSFVKCSGAKNWFPIRHSSDLYLFPLYVGFKSCLKAHDDFLMDASQLLGETLEDFFGVAGQHGPKPRHVALLNTARHGGFGSALYNYFLKKNVYVTALIGLLDLAVTSPNDPCQSLLSLFFEALEKLRDCPGCLLILDKPETWFPISCVNEKFSDLVHIISNFNLPSIHCIFVCVSTTLPSALDGFVDTVFQTPSSSAFSNRKGWEMDNEGPLFKTFSRWLADPRLNAVHEFSKAKIDALCKTSTHQSFVELHGKLFLSKIQFLPEDVQHSLIRFLDSIFEAKTISSLPRLMVCGPAGSGKTLFCESLRCIKKLTVIPMSMSQLVHSALGLSQTYLRSLFNQALESRPSILVFDDIENLAGKHLQEDTQWEEECVSFLCTLLDEPSFLPLTNGSATIGFLVTTKFESCEVVDSFVTRFKENIVRLVS